MAHSTTWYLSRKAGNWSLVLLRRSRFAVFIDWICEHSEILCRLLKNIRRYDQDSLVEIIIDEATALSLDPRLVTQLKE